MKINTFILFKYIFSKKYRTKINCKVLDFYTRIITIKSNRNV